MQIKAADDKQPQIEALEALLAHPGADSSTRQRIEREIRTMRAGISGERDAAYAIEFHYGRTKNRATIHDLRIELDGRVAQIDHLIINRLLDIWVCETKHFSEGVAVDEHDEWVAFYNHRPYGIASPIKQNEQHIAVLADVFTKGIVPPHKRLGITIRPNLNGLVLVSNGARIKRPKAVQIKGLDAVIKIEKLFEIVERAFDKRSTLSAARVVSTSTIEMMARQLVALHRPVHVDWASRFGLGLEASAPSPAVVESPAASRSPAGCARCGRLVSDKVALYCKANEERFGGRTYCYDCQKAVASPRSA
jgi:hypothetical protein